ncbi:hypothetical protein AC579_677 [Pseudocercospora musae]|uniref:Major facilitator superfamily (MFS) profile domain-containing protein n=1 Tax=Pseudocercospora musae TaxID=113226 RepID=A0A139IDJ2_9PEZI|nr:hypothetical protein AC579_677 [Pseudocercospora musae]
MLHMCWSSCFLLGRQSFASAQRCSATLSKADHTRSLTCAANGMIEKHKSGSSSSANWRLSSLWRPLSQHSTGSTTISLREGIACPVVPSLFNRRPDSPPSEYDLERQLISPNTKIYDPTPRQRSNSFGTDESTLGILNPVTRPQTRNRPPTARSLQADAFDRLVRLKTTSLRYSSRSHLHRIAPVTSLAEHRKGLSPTLGSPHHSSGLRRKLQRDSPLPIAELPGLPTSPRQRKLPDSQLSTQPTAIPTYDRDDSIPPPAPPKPTWQSMDSNGDPHLVTLHSCDVANAANWSSGKKWLSTFVFSLIAFCVAFASTAGISASQMTATYFHTSAKVLVLDRALYVVGIAIGSVVWTPMNDRYGRRAPMFVGFIGFLFFQIPVAVAKNLATICICRLLAGLFGCSVLVTVPLAMRDVWEPSRRSRAMSFLAVAIIAGPAVAALFSGYIVQNSALGWRWPSWVVLIIGILLGLCSWMFSSETSSSFVLRQKVKKLRRSTGDWALHAGTDDPEINFAAITENYICRPLALLLTEPILFLITLYVSYAYGLLYLLIEIFPFTYESERRWTLSVAGLPFLAVVSGVLLGSFVATLFLSNRHTPRLKNCHSPEDLLLAFLVGSVALPIGLFLFGWTSARQISAVPNVASGVFLGAGIFLVFLQGNNYLLEVYSSSQSGAVIAVSTSVRSIIAASFCAFARPMLEGMSVKYASTLLALISIVLIPIPVVFFKIGVKVRAMSNCTAKLPGSSHGSDGKC